MLDFQPKVITSNTRKVTPDGEWEFWDHDCGHDFCDIFNTAISHSCPCGSGKNLEECLEDFVKECDAHIALVSEKRLAAQKFIEEIRDEKRD